MVVGGLFEIFLLVQVYEERLQFTECFRGKY